jgi:hypothetical protein
MEKKTLIIIGSIVAGVLVLGTCCCGVGIFFAITKIRDAAQDVADRQQRLNDLKQITLAMHNCHDEKKRMPASVDDLAPYLLTGSAVNRLRSGDIDVVWNALPPPKQLSGTSTVIYAWDTKPSAKGLRLVCYMDGFADAITESEFQSKPKALSTKTSK